MTYAIPKIHILPAYLISIFTLSDIDLNAWLGNLHDDYFPWDKDTIFKKLSYIQQDPSIGCRVISKNLQYGSIIISLKDNANNHGRRTELLEEIKILTSKTSAEWTYSGVSVLRTEYVRYMLRDNFVFLPPIAVIFISILSFIFRNWAYVLLPTLTVIITVIWLLGFMGIFGLEINIMTYIVPTLLIIIGISDAIHIQARFRENFIKYPSDPLEAMLTTMNQMTKVIFLTSVTTAIGFLALMTTSIQIVREFGMEISIGVMFAWLVSILIVPSGIIFSQQFKVRKKDTFQPFLIWLSGIIPNNPWAFIIVPSLISAICIYKIKDISTDASLMDDLRPKNKLYQDLKLTEKNFGGVLPFEILVKTKSKEMKQDEVSIDSEVLQLSKMIQQLLETELKNSRFFSVNNLLESAKRIQAGNKASVSDEILLNQILENQSSGQINLINEGRDVLRITGLIEDKTSNEMKQIYTKLDSLSDTFSEKVSIDYTGTTVVALNTNDYLVQSLVNSLGLALIFISVIMAIMFRTNSILFASLVTNLIPIFSVLGMLLMTSATDLISLYMSLELQSLPLYILAGIRKDNTKSRLMLTSLRKIKKKLINNLYWLIFFLNIRCKDKLQMNNMIVELLMTSQIYFRKIQVKRLINISRLIRW